MNEHAGFMFCYAFGSELFWSHGEKCEFDVDEVMSGNSVNKKELLEWLLHARPDSFLPASFTSRLCEVDVTDRLCAVTHAIISGSFGIWAWTFVTGTRLASSWLGIALILQRSSLQKFRSISAQEGRILQIRRRVLSEWQQFCACPLWSFSCFALSAVDNAY